MSDILLEAGRISQKIIQRDRVASLCNESYDMGRQTLFEEMVDLRLALGYMLKDTGIFQSGDTVSEDGTYKLII